MSLGELSKIVVLPETLAAGGRVYGQAFVETTRGIQNLGTF